MGAEAEEKRALVQQEIAHHLKVHGPKNWELLRDLHPEIGERTFFRWVKSVREKGAGEAIPLATKQARTESMKHVPAAPPPEYLAREGAAGVRQIDFIAALGDLYQDAEQLREFATQKPKEGEGPRRTIKNPILFDSSIKRRLDLITGAIKVMQEIYDLQRMREFYDLIVEEIARESPDAARRIMVRLAELNAKHGLTIHAGT